MAMACCLSLVVCALVVALCFYFGWGCGASLGGMKANTLRVLASGNLACVSGMPSLVLPIEKTLLLGVVGMRHPSQVLLAVATVLVD